MPADKPTTQPTAPVTRPGAAPAFAFQAFHVIAVGDFGGVVTVSTPAPSGYEPAPGIDGAWRVVAFNEARRGWLVQRALVKVG